ncbi:hypothetical protein R1sor_003284 [Riccia sorocarpa]|uniref:Uncharacterized protein n=1 Tax=Riccia sorocarpa TaxID=122646 RepID=A0ABD3H152_9MARC
MDNWRNFFQSSEQDIWRRIDKATGRTEIRKKVYGLRKHWSRRVGSFARKLSGEAVYILSVHVVYIPTSFQSSPLVSCISWMDLVDEWARTCQQSKPTANGKDQSGVAEEKEGLPSPPLDDGALLAGRTTSLEMSQFFDFMDDDRSAWSSPHSSNLSDDFDSPPDSRRENDSTASDTAQAAHLKIKNLERRRVDCIELTAQPKTSTLGLAVKPKAAGEIDDSEKLLLAKERLQRDTEKSVKVCASLGKSGSFLSHLNQETADRSSTRLHGSSEGWTEMCKASSGTSCKARQNRGWMNGRR